MRRIRGRKSYGIVVVLAVLAGLAVAGSDSESAGGGWPGGVQVEVPELHSPHDLNGNRVPTSLDILAGARGEVEKGTRYNSAYFAGGYPPDGDWACIKPARPNPGEGHRFFRNDFL